MLEPSSRKIKLTTYTANLSKTHFYNLLGVGNLNNDCEIQETWDLVKLK
jgi:hypothetical protein